MCKNNMQIAFKTPCRCQMGDDCYENKLIQTTKCSMIHIMTIQILFLYLSEEKNDQQPVLEDARKTL